MDQSRRDFFGSFNILKEPKNKEGKTLIIDKDKCLAWGKTMCFSCKDVCKDDAIDFFGMFNPVINDNCTHCNLCVEVCPSKAIVLV